MSFNCENPLFRGIRPYKKVGIDDVRDHSDDREFAKNTIKNGGALIRAGKEQNSLGKSEGDIVREIGIGWEGLLPIRSPKQYGIYAIAQQYVNKVIEALQAAGFSEET